MHKIFLILMISISLNANWFVKSEVDEMTDEISYYLVGDNQDIIVVIELLKIEKDIYLSFGVITTLVLNNDFEIRIDKNKFKKLYAFPTTDFSGLNSLFSDSLVQNKAKAKEIITEMLQGDTLIIRVQTYSKGDKIFKLPLNGFSKAFSEYNQKNNKKALSRWLNLTKY